MQKIISNKYKNILLIIIGLIASGIIIKLWFSPLNYDVMMGDDLHFARKYIEYSSYSDGYFINIIKSSASSDRFRPFTYAILGVAFKTCGKDYSCFFDINLAIFLLNVLLISINTSVLCRNKFIGIFFAPILFIFSRFSYYSILQVMGIMENVAMMLLLLSIFSAIFFIRTIKNYWMFIIIGLFALIISTHERYLICLLPILSILISNKEKIKPRFLIVYVTLLSIILISYFYFRLFYLNADFLTGTGGTSLTETFNISQIFIFIFTGLLNMIGFNAGPTGLSGKNFLETGVIGSLLGISVSFSLLLLLAFIFIQKRQKQTHLEWNLLIFFLLLFMGLIFSSSITIRQEYRWLYAPFVVLILGIVYFLSVICSEKIKIILSIIILIAYLSVDLYYRNYVNNIFFMVGLQTSSFAKSVIIEDQELNKKPNQDLFLVTNKPYIKNWYFAYDYFFKFYSENNSLNILYFDYVDDISQENLIDHNPLIYQINERVITQIPQDYVDHYLYNKNLDNQTIRYDFVSNFSRAKINSFEKIDSPTGEIAFLWDWLDEYKIINKSITLVSPYSIEFSDISCNKNAVIKLSSGIPFSAGDGAELIINIKNDHNMQKSLEILLPPAKNDQIISWNNSDMIIDEFCGSSFDVLFMAKSSSEDTSYDWVVINSAKIIEVKNDNN